mgnify:CR=1 FL=1
MTSLLLFRDNVGGVYYVPTDTLLYVKRNLSYLITIYTDVVTSSRTSSPLLISYNLTEPTTGAGLAQVQAIYDAWEKALQNKGAIIEVALPLPISAFDPTTFGP